MISFTRKKTGSVALRRIDEETVEILRLLPTSGPLFSYLPATGMGVLRNHRDVE